LQIHVFYIYNDDHISEMRTKGGPLTDFEVGPELAQKKCLVALNSNFLYALYDGKKIRVGYQTRKPKKDIGKVHEVECASKGDWIDVHLGN
jgi:hypothetical protein